MPTCKNCGYTWRWREAMRLHYRQKAACPNCHERQFNQQNREKDHVICQCSF
ncbi:hypothetical protein [Pseudalkalibacillus hwajinpoensis]|uniref:hypothetical protein n=1 Tax=Guptibacillus hwajinpoensis TaxID=208199 RepID=UPI001CFECDF1|nr:hypothetical protein [Pseudalkalibacillus hwajinpoensis]